MNEEDVQEMLFNALDKVAEEDGSLLDYDVNERSITHKLGVYLSEEVDDGWDVDVEYNRVGEDKVSKTISMENLESQISGDADSKDLDAKTVYPDVIVHKRGEPDENLLVIEAKKSGSPGEYDRKKLRSYVDELEYKFGVFVKLCVGGRDEEAPYTCDWYPFEE